MKCPKCNNYYNDDFAFCPHCGEEKPKPLSCSRCGFESNEFKFCPKCGTELKKPAIKKPTKTCSNCGHENAINRKYCERCGTDFVREENRRVETKIEQPKRILLDYVNKFQIEENIKKEIINDINNEKITTKTEISRRVRQAQKEKKEQDKIRKEKLEKERMLENKHFRKSETNTRYFTYDDRPDVFHGGKEYREIEENTLGEYNYYREY